MQTKINRVVVTGIATINPVGVNATDTWKALITS